MLVDMKGHPAVAALRRLYDAFRAREDAKDEDELLRTDQRLSEALDETARVLKGRAEPAGTCAHGMPLCESCAIERVHGHKRHCASLRGRVAGTEPAQCDCSPELARNERQRVRRTSR